MKTEHRPGADDFVVHRQSIFQVRRLFLVYNTFPLRRPPGVRLNPSLNVGVDCTSLKCT